MTISIVGSTVDSAAAAAGVAGASLRVGSTGFGPLVKILRMPSKRLMLQNPAGFRPNASLPNAYVHAERAGATRWVAVGTAAPASTRRIKRARQ